MSLKQLTHLFHNKHASLFQEYNIVINAIPKVWRKNMTRQLNDSTESDNIGIMKTVLSNVNNKRKSKLFYNIILNNE